MTHRNNVASTTDNALRVVDLTPAEVAALASLCMNELEDGRPAPIDPETGCVIDVDGEIYDAIRAIAARPDPRRDALIAHAESLVAA